MHRLHRDPISTPACLANPRVGRRFDELRGQEKEEIRQALHKMQGARCAYCERRTGDREQSHGHIEHLREQKHFPYLALDWNNLFWSCSDPLTCGSHKGNCIEGKGKAALFDPNCLIDPSKDDPDVYLFFAVDGTVQPRDGLSPVARHRAEETIRVFQLNESAYLVKNRHDVIRHFLTAVAHLLDHAPQSLVTYVQSMLAEHAEAPHSTAIRHFLNSVTL